MSLYQDLLTHRDAITVEDFGAGSRRMGNTREISKIFKNSSSRGRYGELLYQLSSCYKPNRILELGTSLGVGTINLQAGNRESIITTVEGCPRTAALALANFDRLGTHKIRMINSTFNSFLEGLESNVSFDLIYVDGHHDGSALLGYVDQLMAHADNNTIFVIDDIRWSSDMRNAWQKLVLDQRFHVSLDLYRMGVLIQRAEQEKQHFTIRL